MKTKLFELHFRYRDGRNELFDVFSTVTTTSHAKAKALGKSLAVERAGEYSGQYWFMSAEPVRPLFALA
jgi:hypothetical protein